MKTQWFIFRHYGRLGLDERLEELSNDGFNIHTIAVVPVTGTHHDREYEIIAYKVR